MKQAAKEKMIGDFANASPCICFNIRKAARGITQKYDEMLKVTGLTATQAAILNCVRMIGPMTVSEMAQAMATDRTTLTRNLKPLGRDGYIIIQQGQDKREREINITKRGRAISLKTLKVFGVFQTKLYRFIGRNRVQRLCQELATTMDGINRM